jgi:transcriptional regulator with XRE-family HTH domain
MTLPLKTTVAAEVRAELARRNIPRSQVADRLGMSRTSVWARLRGDIEFSVSELEQLAEMLGVPVVQFLPTPASAGSAA